MQEITDSHLTACVRALMDHIDQHGLSFPYEISKPKTWRGTGWGIQLWVTSIDADAWVASIVTVSSETQPIPGVTTDQVEIVHGTLPDTGVRISLGTVRPVVAVVAS